MTSPEADILQAKEAARRERSFRSLTDSAQWLDEYLDQTVQVGASPPQADLIHRAPVRKGEADPGATSSSVYSVDEQAQRAEQAQQ